MFYCDDCAKENGYPTSIMKSVGLCEICGKQKTCNDVPSSQLPKREFYCDTETRGLNPITGEKFTMKDIRESFKRIEKANHIISITGTSEKQYPVIFVPDSGNPEWYGGARTLAFVYSRNDGNFVLRGYYKEVETYLKKNYTHYFVNYSLWWHGQHRDIWDFWKDNIGIFKPTKKKRDWKYQIRPYSDYKTDKEEIKKVTLSFKRLPKRWIPEFNQY
ncbi:MAG: hypothetical protein WC428_01700 [Candidatus Paceibacterota bacterium]|jgi:hypothetical protein